MKCSEEEDLQEGEAVSEHQQSSQFIIPKLAGKKELCEVCGVALRKYICPKCNKRSCGILCLNKHKKNGDCSGVADPFASLNGKHIKEKQVEKDYLFVKDMLSHSDQVKRTLSGVDSLGMEPKRFKIMRINARRLHGINLMHAPAVIQRHRQNISFFFVKTKTFYWVVEVLFWRVQKGKEMCSRHLTSPTSDSQTIQAILPEDYLCRDLLEKGINSQKKQQFCVFMERKGKGGTTKVVREMGAKMVLADCLVNQTVYEYPTLLAVHNSLREVYLSARQLQQ